jgi:hypothetical protein
MRLGTDQKQMKARFLMTQMLQKGGERGMNRSKTVHDLKLEAPQGSWKHNCFMQPNSSTVVRIYRRLSLYFAQANRIAS